ncbi:MAG: hypothetical protein K2F90_06015 [Clostridiales bacterium]|nr:hypothetical protein [Clostridiales bacterium]
MKVQTKKLTTAAVCTALAVIACAATAYLPLSFMPLLLAAFCIFLACKRGSMVYGLLCAAASIGLMFLMSGLTVKWLMLVLIFAPYGVASVPLNKLSYFKWKTALIRVVTVIAFFNLTIGVVYLIATNVLTVGLDINVNAWVSKVGGYAVLAVIATAVLVSLDFMFYATAVTVLKKLPASLTKTELIKQKKAEQNSDGRAENTQPEYDIFGYEIKKGDDKKDDE